MSAETDVKYSKLLDKAKLLGKKKFSLDQFPFKNRLVIGVLSKMKAIIKNDDGTYSVGANMTSLTGKSLAEAVSKKWPAKQAKRKHTNQTHQPIDSDSPKLDIIAKELMTISQRLSSIESFLFRIASEGKVVA